MVQTGLHQRLPFFALPAVQIHLLATAKQDTLLVSIGDGDSTPFVVRRIMNTFPERGSKRLLFVSERASVLCRQLHRLAAGVEISPTRSDADAASAFCGQ